MKRLLLSLSAMIFCSPSLAAEKSMHSGITSLQIAKSSETISGQTIAVPQNPDVTVSIVEIPSGSIIPPHKHPSARYGYVLNGALSVTNLVTGTVRKFKQGDFIIESIDQWHEGRNIGTSPTKLLVIDQTERGKANTIFETHPG
ncbi:cupin domain-containing protein [Brucella intermedia]|uniref:cupin domain-containing protein n=1 Tax=Brucella intermedia TaxID=94625 RepID=UPI003B637510